MKINVKIILIILIIIFMTIIPIISYASTGTISPDKYKPEVEGVQNATTFAQKVNVIVGGLQVIGIAASVAILAIMGVKFMMGSAEDKADYKETIVPYLIGAALVFAVTTIPNIIFKFSHELNNY